MQYLRFLNVFIKNKYSFKHNIKLNYKMNKRLTHALMVGMLTLMLFSCDGCNDDPWLESEDTYYSLCLRFEDAEGNSFMDSIPIIQTPLGASREGFFKEIQVDENTNKFEFRSARCNGNPNPKLYTCKLYLDRTDGDEWRLYNNDVMSTGPYCRDTLIYELKFPALFGDDDAHRMVAYWTVPTNKFQNKHYAVCNYIELDGRELQVTQKENLMGIKSAIAITNRVTITP